MHTCLYIHTFVWFIFEKDCFVYDVENGLELQKNVDKKTSQKRMAVIYTKDISLE